QLERPSPVGDVSLAIPAAVRDHLMAGGTDPEHRQATVAFLLVSGVDEAVAAAGQASVGMALHELVTDVQRAAAAHGVSFLATPAVLSRSKACFATTALTPFTVKGKSQPVQSYIVGPLLSERRPDRGHRELGLIGRATELAVLVAAAEASRHGGGGVVHVTG